MNTTYSLTSKFQVTIPKEIRKELHLTGKDRVSFERRGKEVVIKKVPSINEIQAKNQRWLHEKGIRPARQEDYDRAREEFYKKGMKWE